MKAWVADPTSLQHAHIAEAFDDLHRLSSEAASMSPR
jgi:hypothetical protein